MVVLCDCTQPLHLRLQQHCVVLCSSKYIIKLAANEPSTRITLMPCWLLVLLVLLLLLLVLVLVVAVVVPLLLQGPHRISDAPLE